MSSFYPHSNAFPASILLFSFPGNNPSSDNILRIGITSNPNKLVPSWLSNMPLGLGACPASGLVLGAAWQWAEPPVGRMVSWELGQEAAWVRVRGWTRVQARRAQEPRWMESSWEGLGDRMGKVRGELHSNWVEPKSWGLGIQPSQAQNYIENPVNVTAQGPERLVLGTLHENLKPDCLGLNSGYPVNNRVNLQQLTFLSVSQFPHV